MDSPRRALPWTLLWLWLLLGPGQLVAHADGLPAPTRWLEHLRDDIAPFWLSPTALGTPVGEFPTWRCNSGALPDSGALCPELDQDWMAEARDHRYTRMLSRQVYTYGVLFHASGDPAALAAMAAGVEVLRSRFVDGGRGGAVTALDAAGEPVFTASQRTSQDLAYAALGLAMHHYLTGDADSLAHVDNLRRYLFERYWLADEQQLGWLPADSVEPDTANRELVAQLDPLNAFLLLLYPRLPENLRADWAADIRRLVGVLVRDYHDPGALRFYGAIHRPELREHHARHGDFGHSIKAYWMLYWAGRYLAESDWVSLGREGMRSILQRSFTEWGDLGIWVSHLNGSGAAWWEYAEQDQAAATLLLENPGWRRRLSDTYRFWLAFMVDHRRHGIWPGTHGPGGAKQHFWKNGYHAAEHALVAYISMAAFRGEPVILYFALAEPSAGQLSPYYFQASEVGWEMIDPGVQAVRFRRVR